MADLDSLKREILRRGNLPRHVAIIMDGNGRWAAKRMLPRIMGHRAGRKSVRAVIEAAAGLGIEALTLYTFSMENWNRPRAEVKALMSFLEEVLASEFAELDRNGIRLEAMGCLERLPESTRRALAVARERLSGNDGMVLNLALSYGGQTEIVDAARAFADQVASGKARPGDLDEAGFAGLLYRPELPPVDLLIRTSGEQRISNFMLWQIAYAEIYLTRTLWPDFRARNLLQAVTSYQERERRFGKVTS